MKTYGYLVFVTLLPFTGDLPIQAHDLPKEQAGRSGKIVLEQKGYLAPARVVLVAPEVSGRIMALHFEEGTRVRKGDLLGQLDATPYALDLQRAAALVERARSSHQDAVRRKQGVDIARADITAAEQARAKAKYLVEATKVYAPCDGTILSKKAEEGTVIDRLHFNGSFAFCEMADLSKMIVDVSVEERDIHRIFPGQKCVIRTVAFPGVVYKAEVTRVGPMADRAKSTIGVRVAIQIAKPDARLFPEMGAVVSFFEGMNPARSFCLAGYRNNHCLAHWLAHLRAHCRREARPRHLFAIHLDPDSCHRARSLSPTAGDGRVVGIKAFDFHFTILLIADQDQARGDGLTRHCRQ
jgi:Barrel-sandwich domain of CusB or HlyD membrane-fusion